jgi:HEAT repeat protein
MRQQYYLMVLYSVADESVSDVVLPFSKSAERRVREWAIYILAKTGNDHSVPTLIKALNDSAIDPESKEFIAKRLRKLTGQTIEYRANMSPQERIEAYREWTDWWQAQNFEE